MLTKNLLLGFQVCLLAVAALWAFVEYVAPRGFAFEPKVLRSICREAIAKHGGDARSLLPEVANRLQAKYPGIVEDYDDSRWVFNVAGGATGQMMILHASLTEYVIIFGSACGTEGHSGAHLADDFFTILTGEQTAAFVGELQPRKFLPGDQHHHPRYTSAHYIIANETWSLELAQGFIPAMLPFGLIQMPTSLDVDSFVRTIYYTGVFTVKNLLHAKF